MAYVIWRVFMKKYSKIRLGIQHRQLPVSSGEASDDCRAIERLTVEDNVNPSDDPVVSGLPAGRWEEKPDGLDCNPVTILVSNGEQPPTGTADGDEVSVASDLANTGAVRKSTSKAKRVKSYLKKCKDAALDKIASVAGQEEPSSSPSPVQDDCIGTRNSTDAAAGGVDAAETVAASRRRRTFSKRRSNSGGRGDGVSTTSWYIANDHHSEQHPRPPRPQSETAINDGHALETQIKIGVEMFDEGAGEEQLEELVPLEEPPEELQLPPGDLGRSPSPIPISTSSSTASNNAATRESVTAATVASASASTASVTITTSVEATPIVAKPMPLTAQASPGVGDVLDSRNEGGTEADDERSDRQCDIIADVTSDQGGVIAVTGVQEEDDSWDAQCTKMEEELVLETPAWYWEPIHANVTSEEPELGRHSMSLRIASPLSPPMDVASLAERLLRPVYGATWIRVRPALVRQARDLLVTGFQGDLPRFERRFLTPAAQLLRKLRVSVASRGGDVVSVRGWPLTLGSRGAVALHLGELDPTLLRSRDCYLCVRSATDAAAAAAVSASVSTLPATAAAAATPAAAATRSPTASATGVEVALVWRGAEGPPASRPLPPPSPSPQPSASSSGGAGASSCTTSDDEDAVTSSLDSVLAMEEAAMLPSPDTGDQALPALLNTLLVSVERALERVPLDELAFPCPQCREACACACGAPPPAPVQKRDSSIQTSPMFEFAGPIPHIDSDDEDGSPGDDTDADGAKATQTPSRASSMASLVSVATGVSGTRVADAKAQQTKLTKADAAVGDEPPSEQPEAPPPRELVAPRSISELPERLLFAGLQLPGTRDLRGRPILLAITSELIASAPEPHSLAALLLYYCSLPELTKEEQDMEMGELTITTTPKEMTLLVVSGAQETTALDLLDRALALVKGRVHLGSIVVWRPSGMSSGSRWGTLRSSQLRYNVVGGAAALRDHMAEEHAPAACGGRAQHDHREWVDFHKELEPLWALCLWCGRRLASAMGAVRAAEGPPPPGRRRLHAQQRALARALADHELQRLRREGPATLQRLRERAACLPHAHGLRRSAERARRLWEEVDRAARRLEQLCEGRRERLRDLARVRALEEEAEQVLSWLCKKGEETLRRHTNLATNLSAIKEQEQDFEKFYFISMRHLDKGSDLLEEASAAAPGAGDAGPAPRSASGGGLRELARSLKQHLLGFSERLEDTRERLEDTSRCFCLLDKAYEWALETMKYMSRVKADDAQTPEQTLQQLTRLRQYLMAHPPVPEEHFQEMLALARKLANDKLLEQAKVAHARCQETMELIREQQTRLLRTRQQLGIEDDDVPFSPSHGSPLPSGAHPAPATTSSISGVRPSSPRRDASTATSSATTPPPLGWSSVAAGGATSSTPVSSSGGGGIGRRRSVGSFPYIYKCSHHAAGHACSCWDSTSTVLDDSVASAPASVGECTCGPRARPNNLGDIREVRESAEDLLEEAETEDATTSAEKNGEVSATVSTATGGKVCGRCGGAVAIGGAGSNGGGSQATAATAAAHKRYLRRSCTWQYPTEGFDEEDTLCDGAEGHKCGFSADSNGDSNTEGSDGCGKGGDDLEDQDGVANKSVPPVPVNSHLHCHASSLDLQASLQNSSAKDLKVQKTLLLILREMIQTERDYVKSLEYVIENYIPELMREDIPQALRGQRNVIFGNVEKIFEFHSQYFLQELERCENSPLHVGQCFLRHEKKFYLYALYNKNKPNSDSLMSEYGSSFFKAKQLQLGDKMDLASYLLKPVQRMGKYALLLQQLMKAYPEKETDVTDIKAAEQMVRFQLRHGNDLLAMDSLRDCDVNVKEQGRLLRQNEFLVWQGKGKKCLRQVFLFEELILFSKARRFPDRKNLDLYIYKNSIKMTDIGLTAKIGDSPTKFEIWFRKRKPNDTFTLQSMSEEIKQAWTEEISKLLWKQALRNREMRLAEMSSMGIGNKPCLDIRPSADQISDRSISIAQLSKTAPRFRNSISVSSGELLRSNKRPHSIISVSSSSSGGSSSSSTSHSSGSTYGALVNLGFDPVDSPRMHHRSTTLHSQCSTESGIIADISLGSDDTDSSNPHWHVERSNSSVTSMSLDSSMSPTSPVSPSEENKTCLQSQSKDDSYSQRTNDNETEQEELSVKL